MQSDHNAVLANAAQPRAPRPWRELEFWLVVLLALGIYGTRLTDLTIRGEEPRWACVAQQMIASGDYIVPRLQGTPFPDRPPLNSWAMIAASRLTGELNLAAIRLPTVLATVLTVALIYLYGRNYLSRGGALAAAAAYATMGQVLQLGRVAESDALLTLFLTAALLGWHAAYDRRHDPRLAWLVGYPLAALAALCKGPQGPIYFVAITATCLALARDWRFLFSRWHLAGLTAFVAIVALWQVPFALALEPAAAWRVWTEEGNLGTRFQVASWSRALAHWGEFPLEVFGVLLPWSFLLPVAATRWFWQSAGTARPMAVFVVTAFAVAFPTCWLPVESRPRYLMALFPCVALLVGLIVQRSSEAEQIGWWRRSWDNYVATGIALVLAAPLVVGGLYCFGGARLRDLAQSNSPLLLACYATAALAAAGLAHWSRSRPLERRQSLGMLSLAGFMGLSYTGIVVNVQMHTSNDPSAQVAAIRDALPPGEQLQSFGRVHHLFAYYYQQPIPLNELVENVAPADTDAQYFCFSVDPGFETPAVPFAWQPVAEISCERAESDNPRAKVIVGRRVAEVASRPLRPALIDAAVMPATLQSSAARND
ncbi:MAG: glycosyltransferase family 39 protein [Pirellulales bacterium]